MVCSGQISRKEALEKLATPPYTPTELEEDFDYVTKKLGFSRVEFDAMMAEPPHAHTDYPSEYPLFKLLQWMKRKIYGARLPGVEQ